MKLRQKILLLVSAALLSSQTLIYLLVGQLFLTPIQNWQEQQIKQEVGQVVNNLSDQIADVNNLLEKSFRSPVPLNQDATESLDLLLWQDSKNGLKVKHRVNFSENLAEVDSKNFLDQHPNIKELWQHSPSEMPVVGLLDNSTGLFLIVGQSAIAPQALTQTKLTRLILGRYLEPTTLLPLSASHKLSLNLHPLNRGELPSKFAQLRPLFKKAIATHKNKPTSHPVPFSSSLAKSAPIVVFPKPNNLSNNLSTGYTVLPDIYGQPLFLLELQINSAGDKNPSISNGNLIGLLLSLGLGLNGVILILLDRLLLQNLTKFSQSIQQTTQNLTKDSRHAYSSSLKQPQLEQFIRGDDELSVIGTALANLHSEFKQIEQERNKIQAYYQAIADSATCLITRHSLDGEFLDVSPACTQLLGYQPEELIGKSIDQLFHPEDLAQINQLYATITENPVTLTFCHRCQRKDGDYIWLETRSQILQNPDPENLLEVFWISHDITDRQQTEAQLKQTEASMRQLYKITASSKLSFAQKLQRLLLMGRRTFDLKVGILSQIEGNRYQVIAAQSFKQAIASGTVFNLNQTYCQKTYQAQSIVYFESLMVSLWHSESIESPLGQEAYIGIPVMVDGNIYGTLSFFSSVPRQIPFKNQDQELLQLMAQWIGHELERIQAEDQLAQSRDEAVAATHAKSEFLATMSHEIRTPMNAVIGMTSLLLDTPLTSQQKDFIETIQNSGDALLIIINDILDFSKIEAGKIELEEQPFNLHESIESALDLLANKANDREIELAYFVSKFTPNLMVGDLTRVRQILVNLLSNAIKFTEIGEVVLVVFSKLRKEVYPDLLKKISNRSSQIPTRISGEKAKKQYEIIFSIQDTGIGIPEDRISRLFKSFSQVNASTTREYGGTGLGLAISKSLSEMMGGRMWVVSGSGIAGSPPENWQEIEQISRSLINPVSLNSNNQYPTIPEQKSSTGSRFYFTIVSEEIPSSAVWQIPPGIENYLENKRLLIVDDNQTTLKILSVTSQAWGMSVETANSATEGLSLLQTGEPFDLVILDLKMPEIDGMEMASEIRALPNYAEVPLVMMIPLGTKVKDDGLELTAFLNKPIKKSQLFNVLSAVFGRQPLSSRSVEFSVNSVNQPQIQLAPINILLAEDHLVNQKVALQMLERIGYQADIANNGLEAIAALQQKTYDVVLMDVQMPEMNGLEAAQKIGAEFAAGRLSYKPRIIAMTANAMIGDREACLAAGMDDYISKPIRMIELSQALSLCEPLETTRKQIQPNSPAGSLPELISTTPSPKEAPQNQPTIQPLLDANILNSLREIDALEEVIEIYLIESPKLLQKINQAIANGDLASLRDGAHSLKSTSAALGANTLAQLSKTLEEMIRAAKTTEAPALISKIETEYRLVKAALELEITTD